MLVKGATGFLPIWYQSIVRINGISSVRLSEISVSWNISECASYYNVVIKWYMIRQWYGNVMWCCILYKRMTSERVIVFNRYVDKHQLAKITDFVYDWVSHLSLNLNQYITVTSLWARWHLKSRASRLFTQPFIHAQIKENIKTPRHWPLCGEFTGDQWIPHTNGQ